MPTAISKQGDPNYEVNQLSQIVFSGDTALIPNDSNTAPSPTDTSLNGIFIRLRTNGDMVFYGSGNWNITNRQNILTSANSYSDASNATTLTTAQTFATNGDTAVLTSSKNYSDSQDITNLASAKSYTDTQVQAFLSNASFGGSVIPTSNPNPTINSWYLATQAGTYTNMGSVVVSTNSFAVISFKASGSVWSISQTTLDLTLYTLQSDFLPVQSKTSFIIDQYIEGWTIPFTDKDGRLLFGINSKGDFYAYQYVINTINGSALKDISITLSKLGTDVTQGLWTPLDPNTGYALAMLDLNNRKLIAVNLNGDVELSGISISKLNTRVTTIENAISTLVLPKEGRHWGDSLTAGTGGGGVTYSSVLQSLLGLGYNIINCGVGGEDVNSISARQGGIPVQIQTGFTLPADGSTVQIFTTSDTGVLNKYGKQIKPLLQGAGNSVNPCYISGIECNLSYVADNVSVDPYTGKYYIQRNVPASSHMSIPSSSLLILNGSQRKNAYYDIYWMGQNGGYVNEDDLVNYYKDIISYNNNSNYIIIGLHTGTASSRSTLETKMFTAFGSHYLNWRQYVVNFGLEDAGISPTSADISAIAVGSCPPSLLFDSIHLNAAGYTVLGNILYKLGKEIGIF